MTGTPNLAARAGRWSAAHWKIATFGWLGFVVVAFALGNAIGMHALAQSASGNGESGRASQALAGAGFRQPASETVLIQSETEVASAADFRMVIASVVRSISKVPSVADISSPLDTAGET